MIVDDVAVHVSADGSLDNSKTDLYIHAIETGSNQVIDASLIVHEMDRSPEEVRQLKQDYLVTQIRELVEDDDDDQMKIILAAIFGGVGALLLFILWLALICFLRRY